MSEPTWEDIKRDIHILYHRIARIEDIVKRLDSETEEVRRIQRILDGIDPEAPPFVDPEYMRKDR